MSSSLNDNHKSKSNLTQQQCSANDARLKPQSETSSTQPTKLNEEEEEYIKHVQRRIEIHKRELKYELLLDLKSKLGK